MKLYFSRPMAESDRQFIAILSDSSAEVQLHLTQVRLSVFAGLYN